MDEEKMWKGFYDKLQEMKEQPTTERQAMYVFLTKISIKWTRKIPLVRPLKHEFYIPQFYQFINKQNLFIGQSIFSATFFVYIELVQSWFYGIKSKQSNKCNRNTHNQTALVWEQNNELMMSVAVCSGTRVHIYRAVYKFRFIKPTQS